MTTSFYKKYYRYLSYLGMSLIIHAVLYQVIYFWLIYSSISDINVAISTEKPYSIKFYEGAKEESPQQEPTAKAKENKWSLFSLPYPKKIIENTTTTGQ